MLTSFGIGFIFIVRTLLLLIFQIHIFWFRGLFFKLSVSLSIFYSNWEKQTWPKNLNLIIWNINSNKVRAIKINPMPKEVNIWWTKIFVKWFLAWHWWYYGKKQRGVEGPSNCFAARGRFDVCIRRPGPKLSERNVNMVNM